MKIKIILSYLYLTLLLIYPKMTRNRRPTTLSRRKYLILFKNSTTETKPCFEQFRVPF